MKKSFFFALAAAAVLASCSSEDAYVAADGGNEVADNGLVKIEVGLNSAGLQTRGTGTVGDLAGSENNVWQGQEVNIIMLNQGKMTEAEFGTATKEAIFWGASSLFTTAVTGAANDTVVATPISGAIKYYPASGVFDFWGYRLDDAVADLTAEPAVELAGEDTVALYHDIVIDGSQDIMVAKVCNELTGNEKAFSAYSARRGVQPILKFEHVLSRLVFTLKAGAADTEKAMKACGLDADGQQITDGGVFVDSIKVWSKATGKLVVAYTPAVAANYATAASQLTFDGEAVAMSLKERTGAASDALTQFTPLTPQWDVDNKVAKTDSIGEALLVAPAEEYKVEVYTSETVNGNKEEDMVEATLKLADAAFEAGKSYSVNISVYALEQIEIKAVLTGWIDGGVGGVIDPDADDAI